VETHPRHLARTGPPPGRAKTHSQRRHHRQPIRKDHGKRGLRGYDAGKKINGRKRHIVVDTLGMVLAVKVHEASMQDRDGAKLVLQRLRKGFSRLKLIWADGAYAGALVQWTRKRLKRKLEIVKRNDDVKGFAVIPKRWIVERTFGWLGRYRRFAKDYEQRTDNSEAMIYIAMINLMTKRLAQ
jgi:putative transposase